MKYEEYSVGVLLSG